MMHLLSLLKENSHHPCFFWKGRGSTTASIGYGAHRPSPLTFQARTFHPRGCQGLWEGFPEEWSFSPSQLLSTQWVPTVITPQLPHCIQRIDNPSVERWQELVIEASHKIEEEEFNKVVLARCTTLLFDAPVDPQEVLKGLMAFGNTTSLFLAQMDRSTAFVGASPEKLFKRFDRKIWTEALAGTIDQWERWSPKEFAEVEAVRLYLQQQLLPCCHHFHWQNPEERPFGHLRHLYQKLEGSLKTKISDQLLISQLHPTPALGGFPRDRTVEYLRAVEPFERGWYGAPIGLVSSMETDLAVAIRSMLVRGNALHLFAGAGIVKGSEPLKEWEELDRKIRHILKWCESAAYS